MNTEHNRDETLNLQSAGEPSSANATDQNILGRSAGAYGQAERALGDAYDKTTHRVSETYEKAKSYSTENPGKTIFIALGIGVGLGLLLGASSHHRSRTSRIAEPVVNALSDVALAFFR